jgi:hypothetical protein
MDEYHGNVQDDEISEPAATVRYSELTDPLREEAHSEIEKLIGWFIEGTGDIPERDDIEWIIQTFCEEFSEAVNCSGEQSLELIPDDGIMSVIDEILEKLGCR